MGDAGCDVGGGEGFVSGYYTTRRAESVSDVEDGAVCVCAAYVDADAIHVVFL